MRSRAVLVWVTASLVSGACVSSPPPRDPTPEVEPDTGTMMAEAEPARVPGPSATESAASIDAEAPTTSQPAAATTGVPECEEYLALYERCEEYLEPQIMAGERRFAHAERAWLEYVAGTPEAASLPSACSSMLDALRSDCPDQHRAPLTPG